MIIRTRFAPSPTGDLHFGNIRTALYSWLYARHQGGEFILRIEDTDRERSTQAAADTILESMRWLGLNYLGPFYQAERMEYFRSVAQKLIDSGKAYRCYCTKERLDKLREQQLANKEKPRYDGCCRDKNLPEKNEPYVIRFKNPLDGEVTFVDQVMGKLTFKNNELDDLVIIKADGYPTYNFSVVIDDSEMKITHVVRGAGHINNTPRQINIFHALNATPPTFAHVPLVLGSDGKLLSKRHGALSVLQYREMGYLPEALLNYLVRLGWSHGDQEIFSREEMISLFDITHISKSPAAFNAEKLLWLNRHYIKTLAPQLLSEQVLPHLQKLGLNPTNGPALAEVILAQRERAETLQEIAIKSRFFYEDITVSNELKAKYFTADHAEALHALQHRLSVTNDWTKEALHSLLKDVATQFNLKLGDLAQPLRIAVTGGTVSPPIDITLQLLEKRRTLERLEKVLKKS